MIIMEDIQNKWTEHPSDSHVGDCVIITTQEHEQTSDASCIWAKCPGSLTAAYPIFESCYKISTKIGTNESFH